MLAEWGITPSWSILVMTSPAFIWGSPIIPILGVCRIGIDPLFPVDILELING